MEYKGWIKLHRKIMDSNMYKSLNAIQRDVMMQCLLLASHKHNKWIWKGKLFECKPGQFITSLESLLKVCAKGTTRKNIMTALRNLEKWEFLECESNNQGRLITICNWEIYQKEDYEDIINTGRRREGDGKATGRRRESIKNDKNDKEINIEHFEKLWEKYPKKLGKKQAFRHMSASIKNQDDFENCCMAIDNYKEEIDKNNTEDKFIKHGSTFFNNWQDWTTMNIKTNQNEIVLESHIPEGAV